MSKTKRIWTAALWSLLLFSGALLIHDARADGGPAYAFYINLCDGDTSVTSSNQTISIPASGAAQLVISATATTYVQWGGNSVTVAVGSGHRILAGVEESLTPPAGATKLAFIGSSGGSINTCWGVGL